MKKQIEQEYKFRYLTALVKMYREWQSKLSLDDPKYLNKKNGIEILIYKNESNSETIDKKKFLKDFPKELNDFRNLLIKKTKASFIDKKKEMQEKFPLTFEKTNLDSKEENNKNNNTNDVMLVEAEESDELVINATKNEYKKNVIKVESLEEDVLTLKAKEVNLEELEEDNFKIDTKELDDEFAKSNETNYVNLFTKDTDAHLGKETISVTKESKEEVTEHYNVVTDHEKTKYFKKHTIIYSTIIILSFILGLGILISLSAKFDSLNSWIEFLNYSLLIILLASSILIIVFREKFVHLKKWLFIFIIVLLSFLIMVISMTLLIGVYEIKKIETDQIYLYISFIFLGISIITAIYASSLSVYRSMQSF
ncbi:MAG: YIP1 family protein [Mollicutes bacterium PWAP]|nr:YIP1 family protein [Mollicutes bacterium PWAP]